MSCCNDWKHVNASKFFRTHVHEVRSALLRLGRFVLSRFPGLPCLGIEAYLTHWQFGIRLVLLSVKMGFERVDRSCHKHGTHSSGQWIRDSGAGDRPLSIQVKLHSVSDPRVFLSGVIPMRFQLQQIYPECRGLRLSPLIESG